MKKILIVEDKEIAALALEKIVKEECSDSKVFVANELESALAISMMHDIELMLVDIVLNPAQKNDISGIEFVTKIRGVDRYRFVPIIMVTSLEDPRMIAYEQLHCFGFVEKPYDEEKIRKVIREAIKYRPGYREEKFVFKSEGILYSVEKKDIVYIQNRGKRMTLKLEKDEMVIPYVPIKKMAEELEQDFIQCSRNCIVNKRYIDSVDLVNRVIEIRGTKEKLEIGIRMKNNLREF